MDSSCQWQTSDFLAGDVVIFGMGLVHASTANLTDRVRMSCDVRWQPAADPVDDRYEVLVGKRVYDHVSVYSLTAILRYMRPNEPRVKSGAEWAARAETGTADDVQPRVTIELLKERWGFSPSSSRF